MFFSPGVFSEKALTDRHFDDRIYPQSTKGTPFVDCPVFVIMAYYNEPEDSFMSQFLPQLMNALIRVSTEEQNENRQVEKMLKLGVPIENIVIEKESGKSTARTKYHKLVSRLKRGNILFIENIDRLSRDYDGIITEWHKLIKKGVIVKVLDTPIIDTDGIDNSLFGRFMRNIFLHILAFQAENEWHKIKERQRQGIDVMPIVNGKRISIKTKRATGRPKAKITKRKIAIIKQYQNREIDLDTALILLKIKKSAFYNLSKAVKGK